MAENDESFSPLSFMVDNDEKSQVLKAFNNPDFFNIVFPLLFEMCNLAYNMSGQVSSPNDVDKAEADKANDASVPHDKIIDCITSCILVARLSDILKCQKDLVHVFLISLAPAIPWTVKVCVFKSLKELCSRLNEGLKDTEDASMLALELFNSVSPKVVECIATIKIAQVHIAASECLEELTKLYRALPKVPTTQVAFKSELVQQWEIEKNEQAKTLMKSCIDILDSLHSP